MLCVSFQVILATFLHYKQRRARPLNSILFILFIGYGRGIEPEPDSTGTKEGCYVKKLSPLVLRKYLSN
jgi:hypothetical protein